MKGVKQPGPEALKKKFLQCIGLRSTSATALQEVIKKLIEQGLSRKTLVAWAVQGGYSKGHASTLLSRIFSALGLRERKAGAGRKPLPDTLELLAHAQAKYGKRAIKVLRAAWRAGKAQASAGLANCAPLPMHSPGAYYGPVIKRNGKAAARSSSHQVRQIHLQKERQPNGKSEKPKSRHTIMKLNPHWSDISHQATATTENRSGVLSNSPSAVSGDALRIGCITILLLLVSISGFAQPAIPNQIFYFPPTFDTSSGSTPINYTTDLISFPVNAAPNYGNALILDSTNLTPSALNYNVLDTVPRSVRNINYASGTVLFYFAPNWASVSQGGTGPGATAYFIAGGDWTSGSPNGLFAIYTDASGSNIYFGGVKAGTSTTYASAPISWASNTFHQIGVEWTTDDSEIYLDGALAASSNGVSLLPNSSTWPNGFMVGSDNNGFSQSRGATYDLTTWLSEEGGTYTGDWISTSNSLVDWQSSLGGGGFGGMMGMMGGSGFLNSGNGCNCSCVSNTTVYLTNIVAVQTNSPGMTFTFTIEGGTNGINYDIFATTNLVGNPATNSVWTWLGSGTNCGTYIAVNQATNASFYILGGTNLATDGSGHTTAFETLIPNWNYADPTNAGNGVLRVTIVSPAQGAIIQ